MVPTHNPGPSDRAVISFVIPTRDRLAFLQGCIQSIRDAAGSSPDIEIVVVDGDSRDGTGEWLALQPDVVIVPDEPAKAVVRHGRETWGSFMNRGFERCRGEFICMLSDDCLLAPNALAAAHEAFRIGGPRCGGIAFAWRDWPFEDVFRTGRTFGDRVFVNHGLFRAAALADVGYCDADNFTFYHADTDMALRLDAAGWKVEEAPASIVEHFAHANMPLRRSNLTSEREDWATLESRWSHLGPLGQWHRLPIPSGYDVSWCRAYWGPQRRIKAKARILTAIPTVARRLGYRP